VPGENRTVICYISFTDPSAIHSHAHLRSNNPISECKNVRSLFHFLPLTHYIPNLTAAIHHGEYFIHLPIPHDKKRLVRSYTGCPRRNVPDFGTMFLMMNYTDKTQNTYIQIWTVTEIMAREFWKFDSCYSLIDYQIHIGNGRNMWFL